MENEPNLQNFKYRLNIKALQGNILTFHINEYTIREGLIEFLDLKENVIKKFPITNVEITQINNKEAKEDKS